MHVAARPKCFSGKLVALGEMESLAESYRGQGKAMVFTNGCFDLLHVGHVASLQQAACLGDILVVGVNSDRSVRQLKGPGRPVVGERDRAAMVAALDCVAHVLIFDDATPLDLLRRLRPNVLAKGGTGGAAAFASLILLLVAPPNDGALQIVPFV